MGQPYNTRLPRRYTQNCSYHSDFLNLYVCHLDSEMQHKLFSATWTQNRALPFVYAYMDEILVFSPNMDEHIVYLTILFNRFKGCSVSINISKYIFSKPKVTFLGRVISSKGIAPLSDKLAAIAAYSKPKTVQELKRFSGTINIYHCFHHMMAVWQAPLQLK